ncbi:MAG: hypothetical protein AAF333_08495 [Planctomycetota bacterium]
MLPKSMILSRNYRSLAKRVLLLFVLLWTTLLLSGCNIIGWGAQVFRDDDKPIPVAAEYTDLDEKRVAVLVSADEYTLFRFPRSPFVVSTTVSNSIANNVPGVAVSLPREIDEFQRRNPYWITARPSRLIKQLGVDRLVVIELNEYRTNEEGNANVWRGVIDGMVAVYEAEAEVPDNRVFEKQVRAEFPENSEFGMISYHAEEEAIEAAVLELFTLRAAGLFFDHEEAPPR